MSHPTSLDLDSSSFVSTSSSEGSPRDHRSSSDESLPIRTYTTIRVEELSRLHTIIANIQADVRRCEKVVGLYQQEIDVLRATIRRLRDEKMIGWVVGLGAFALGLGLGIYAKFKMT